MSINLLMGTMPIVIGGDKDGQLTFLTLESDPQSQQVPLQCTQGGHTDMKPVPLPIIKVFIFKGANMDPALQNSVVTIDTNGNFRLWK